MNQDLTNHERLHDQWNRPLEWRGRWVLHNPYGGVAEGEAPVLPAESDYYPGYEETRRRA